MGNKLLFALVLVILLGILPGCNDLLDEMDDDHSILRGSGNIVREDRQINHFNRVSIAISGDVFLQQGEEESLSLETDDNLLRFILTEVSNDTLFIRFSKEVTNFQPSRANRILLEFKELKGLETSGSSGVKSNSIVGGRLGIKLAGSGDVEIEHIKMDRLLVDLSGSGSIFSEDVQAGYLGIALGGSGDVQFTRLSAEKIGIENRGSGDVRLAGDVKEQKINIPGSGDYEADDLQSEIAFIGMVATGQVTVWTEEHLSIRIHPGKGKVVFYGNPHLELAAIDLKNVRRIKDR
jgi:hypothetical protein